jgi:hypothetical protein
MIARWTDEEIADVVATMDEQTAAIVESTLEQYEPGGINRLADAVREQRERCILLAPEGKARELVLAACDRLEAAVRALLAS